MMDFWTVQINAWELVLMDLAYVVTSGFALLFFTLGLARFIQVLFRKHRQAR